MFTLCREAFAAFYCIINHVKQCIINNIKYIHETKCYGLKFQTDDSNILLYFVPAMRVSIAVDVSSTSTSRSWASNSTNYGIA